MKIKKGLKREYKNYVKINSNHFYSKAVIDYTEKVGDLLDKGLEPKEAFWTGVKDSGITGFQSGCIASAIARFHPRGEEFRKWWNLDTQIKDEGEKANKKKGTVLNPALITISKK